MIEAGSAHNGLVAGSSPAGRTTADRRPARRHPRRMPDQPPTPCRAIDAVRRNPGWLPIHR